MIKIKQIESLSEDVSLCILFNTIQDFEDMDCTPAEKAYIRKSLAEKDRATVVVNQYKRYLIFVQKPQEQFVPRKAEKLRVLGHTVHQIVTNLNISELQIENATPSSANILDFLEGFVLSAYSFDHYKSKRHAVKLKLVSVYDFSLTKESLKALNTCIESVFLARDLVNEPASVLTTTEFANRATQLGKKYGFRVDVWEEKQIREAKMGGILGVNAGSVQPPYFLIMEHKPKKTLMEKPIVLVGKGVVYDTGGYSLKPADSLDWMKCDMAGAAAVLSTICYHAALKTDMYILGLIPLTDNRLDGDALVPGDIITISDGTTVEVLNTDAEGRLILADALVYAKRFNPALVIDIATLTGSAMRAIGTEGLVYMGVADTKVKSWLEEAGYLTHERVVEFPLWDEYAEQLKSDIADIKNIGGETAGAITAGMFLKHFTDYPWLHLDIAGVAYLKTPSSYRGKHGTGVGVRLLIRFLEKWKENHFS